MLGGPKFKSQPDLWLYLFLFFPEYPLRHT